MNRAISAFVFLALAACADDAIDPPGTGGSGGGTVQPAEPGSFPEVQIAKRTVIQREPFGNVAATQNLLWDGDFEWASAFTDQYGWFEPPTSLVLGDVVMGPECRSGLKCGRVKKNNDILGIAVGSTTRALVASVWVKFQPGEGEDSPSCTMAEASIIDAETLYDAVLPDLTSDVELTVESEEPGADGWCKLSGLVSVRAHKPYFRVANTSAMPMLADDAVLIAEDETADPLPPPARPIDPKALSLEKRAALTRAKLAIRASRQPHDGAPNQAREAFEAFQKSRGHR